MDKGLLFFVLSLICFWIVLGEIYGEKPITSFVLKLLPDSEK